MKNKKILLSFIVLAGLVSLSQAQSRYRSSLSAVDTAGFYRVDLPMDMTGKSAPLLTDVRITDEAGKEIAYLLRKDAYTKEESMFIPYPVEFLTSDDRKTRIVVETGGDEISTLALNIKNADARKTATLEGSNDRIQWFSVREKVILSANYSQEQPEAYATLDLPLSDYLYYKLTVDDSLSAPLNIKHIGQIKSTSESFRHMLEIPVKKTSTLDSAGTTTVTIDYAARQAIKNVRFYISAPAFYKRDMYISGESRTFTLRSDDTSSLLIRCNQRTDRMTVRIQNNDNTPLSIDSVRAYTDKLFLVAYLPEPGNYFLTYGDSTAQQPDYDLISFADKIPATPQKLSILSTETTIAPPVEDTNHFLAFLKKYGIWAIIVIVSAQVLYSVWKMSKK